jgi:GWxTD domain-containing protein
MQARLAATTKKERGPRSGRPVMWYNNPREKRMKKTPWFVVVAAFAFAASCRLYNLEQKLKPEDAAFLSKVQYIITGEERKIFLELPDSERAAFQEEFWKRRDPDPDTPGNEYKTDYFQRVDRASAMFHGEGRAGWLTDRGRIFILFGPPSERMTYPMEASGYCREVWYYGSFPVIFIDEHCSGSFILTAVNLEHLQELNIAQSYFQKTFTQEKKLFDYDVTVVGKVVRGDRYEGSLVIEIPYRSLWFTAKGGKLATTLTFEAMLKTSAGKTFWQNVQAFDILADEDELKAKRDESYRMELLMVLEGDLGTLRQGKSLLQVSLKNSTEGEILRKAVEFRLDRN